MDIEQTIIEANRLYREGSPCMSDEEFDTLLDSLSEDHYLKKEVGYKMGKTEPLPHRLGSLNKIKTIEEYSKWKSKYKNIPLIFMPKLDGLTLLLHYKQGKLTNAWTRGDGYEGTNVKVHAKQFCPCFIREQQEVYVIGEAIMKKSVFAKFYSKDFKNPRNLAAGILGREEVDRRALHLDFKAFRYLKEDLLTLAEELKQCKQYFETVPRMVTVSAALTSTAEEMNFDSKSLQDQVSDYECDGMVVAVNEKLGFDGVEANGLNPKWARAWKPLSDESVESEVEKINWQCSKNGVLTPVVQIKPIELKGVTISNASGHNAKNILDLQIDKGAKVKVIRSGDVIPYITEVTEKISPSLPVACECCNQPASLVGVDLVIDKPSSCPEVEVLTLEFFLATLGIENLKYKTLKKHSLSYDIISYSIKEFEQYFSRKTAEKHHAEIQSKIKSISRAKLMHATSIFSPGLGERKLSAILAIEGMNSLFGRFDRIAIESEIAKAKGFSEASASFFVSKLPAYFALEETLVELGLTISREIAKAPKELVSKKVFVMTGFRDKELASKLEGLGWVQGNTISKKTELLIVKDINSTSSKVKKAKELNIEIRSRDEMDRVN